MAMLIISPLLIAGTKVRWPHLHEGLPGGDEAYAYIGILSILLVHYAQDTLLFCDPKSITGQSGAASVPIRTSPTRTLQYPC